ncbi:MAG: hypothetical protein ACK5AZ_26030 [Bryobacteraceae bacterium]
MKGYTAAGWIKLWRSAVQEDMELTPHEFKFWTLLQAISVHTTSRKMDRGSVELSYSNIRVILRGEDSRAKAYSYSTLSKSLTRLIETGRIERLDPGKGNRVRVRIKQWDLLQHGNYDAVSGAKGGWLKVWRWAVLYEDMDLSPDEFKLWYLLLSLASHADSEDARRTRGTVKTTFSNLRATLTDASNTDKTLSRVLKKLEQTDRIEPLCDAKGGILRLHICDWDLMQHRDYLAERWDAL